MITIAGLPNVEAQACAIGRAAYEARFAHEPARCVTPWDELQLAAQMIWIRTALAAVGAAIEITGLGDLPPAEVAACDRVH